jgi:hypothetical protein
MREKSSWTSTMLMDVAHQLDFAVECGRRHKMYALTMQILGAMKDITLNFTIAIVNLGGQL